MRKKNTRLIPEINVTPLVDVVLVLLIIFMVVAPQMQAGIDVKLPHMANPDDPTNNKLERITLSITSVGDVYLDKEHLRAPSVEARLVALHAANPLQRVLLKADQSAHYGKVRSLFATCQKVGFAGVTLQVADADKDRPGA